MIGNGAGNELIDQAFFGFSRQDGLSIIASSLSSNDEALKWQAQLRQHVRLQGHPGTPLPSHALSYFLFPPESAAVLRRVSRGDSVGRNNSHVLIGPSRVLTTRVALGLELWPGWTADPPVDRRMPRLDPWELDCGFDPAHELRAQVRDKPDGLERVLGWLLERPGRPLNIIGCPVEHRIALLWGLMEIGESVLESRDVRRNWTFSTYETGHSDGNQFLPEMVCLPARPDGLSAADRTSVDLTRDGPASPLAAGRAHTLVEQYIHGRPAPAEPDRADPAGPDLTEPDQPESAEPDRPSAADPAQATRQIPQQIFTPAVSAFSAPDSAGSPDMAGMVHSLMAAPHSAGFEEQLARIERCAASVFNRQKIRTQLDNENYGILAINRLLSKTDHETVFKRLIVVAFGPSLVDFNDPMVRRYAETLIETSRSNEFIRVLIKVTQMHNRYEQISPSVERRWPGQQKSAYLDQSVRSQPAHTPVPGAGEHPEQNQSGAPQSSVLPVVPVQPAPGGLPDNYRKLIFVAGLILSLLLSFVLGMFTENITSDSSVAAVAAAPTTSEPPPPEPPKDATIKLSVTPKQRLPEDKKLWLLARRADGVMFPQPQPCSPAADKLECTQIYKFPDADTTDYRVLLVIADRNATEELSKYKDSHPEGTPGDGIKDLPAGAAETDLTTGP